MSLGFKILIIISILYSDTVYITIDLPDAQDVKLKLEPDGKFLFTATTYEVDLDLFDKIDINSKASIGLRTICYLVKKAETKWWSRLIKQEGKAPVFLKVDWDKWVDEDDDEEAPGPGDNMDFGDLDFSKLNMGGGVDALDDEFDDSSDSEDENVEEAPADSAGSDTKLPARMKWNLQSDEKAFNWCSVYMLSQSVLHVLVLPSGVEG